MALYRSPDYQTNKSIGFLVQEKKFNIDFEDDRHEGHLGFLGLFLAIFDL